MMTCRVWEDDREEDERESGIEKCFWSGVGGAILWLYGLPRHKRDILVLEQPDHHHNNILNIIRRVFLYSPPTPLPGSSECPILPHHARIHHSSNAEPG